MLDRALANKLFAMEFDSSTQLLAHKLMAGFEAMEDEYDSVLVRLDILLRLARKDDLLREELRDLRDAVERRRVQGQIRFDLFRLKGVNEKAILRRRAEGGCQIPDYMVDELMRRDALCAEIVQRLRDYIGYNTYVSVRSSAQAWLMLPYKDDNEVDEDTGFLHRWEEIIRAAAMICADRSWIFGVVEIPKSRGLIDPFFWSSCPAYFAATTFMPDMTQSKYGGYELTRIGSAVKCAKLTAEMFNNDPAIIEQIIEVAIVAVEEEVSRA